MAAKTWKVVVAKLGAEPQALHEREVIATNWMAALRGVLEAMGETPAMPPGASCAIDADGTATVIDPGRRRRFRLAPVGTVANAGGAATPAPSRADAQGAPPDGRNPPTRRRVVQTRDFAQVRPGQRLPTPIPIGGPATPTRREPPRTAPAASAPGAQIEEPLPVLELLYERNEDPNPDSPLCYRERAYLLPRGTNAVRAEAALKAALSEVQQLLEGRLNRFVALAAFDHRWQDHPERPPTVVLQWRDWREGVHTEFPASVRLSSAPPPSGIDDRDEPDDALLADERLTAQTTQTEGLEFALELLEKAVPAEAASVCLYDSGSDELRFAALSGPFATSMHGYAVPRAGGLFGKALSSPRQATVFADVLVEPAFNPLIDSRPGLDSRTIMLRPIVREEKLLGVLQLINRRDGTAFTARDIHVVDYVADRLAAFLSD